MIVLLEQAIHLVSCGVREVLIHLFILRVFPPVLEADEDALNLVCSTIVRTLVLVESELLLERLNLLIDIGFVKRAARRICNFLVPGFGVCL